MVPPLAFTSKALRGENESNTRVFFPSKQSQWLPCKYRTGVGVVCAPPDAHRSQPCPCVAVTHGDGQMDGQTDDGTERRGALEGSARRAGCQGWHLRLGTELSALQQAPHHSTSALGVYLGRGAKASLPLNSDGQ